MSGIRIGNYEIISTVGRGSIGVVYKAKDVRLDRIVAVKALKSVFLENANADNIELKRFYQESKSAGSLRHPNIVKILDVGCTELGSPYIVMDFVVGQTLAEILQQRKRLESDEVLKYLYPLASAIDYAHSQGVIHRDINPNNIIIDDAGRPCLLDFSLAKIFNQSITPTGALIGSPGYMAPELIDGRGPTTAVDIFSFGVLAYELLTGQAPFDGDDIVRIVFAIINEKPRSFADAGVDLPLQLQRVIEKAVEKNPGERYTSATSFVEKMEAVLTARQEELEQLLVSLGSTSTSGSSGVYTSVSTGSVKEKLSMEEIETLLSGWGDFSEPREVNDATDECWDLQKLPRKRVSTIKQKQEFLARLTVALITFAVVFIVTDHFYSPVAAVVENAIVHIGNAITDKKVAQTYHFDQSFAPLDKQKFSAASNKKLLALLQKGTNASSTQDIDRLRSAIYAAGSRKDSAMTEVLKQLSAHSDELIRSEALRCLARIAHRTQPGVLEAFLQRLNDKDYLVRGYAIRGLSNIGDQKTLDALRQQKALEESLLVRGVLEEAIDKLEKKLAKSPS